MEPNPYVDLQPVELWRHFAALNAIPRRSGDEGAARDYVRQVALDAGAECEVDERGNLLVRVPARPGATARDPVAVQAHLDMVCASAPGVEHDFERDPIVPRREGDRISASGTTLGADNGIGVASALALITEADLDCGPLELLFTVEEEIGLLGALHFDASSLLSRSLINLDSEDDRALTVGCAGGREIELRLDLGREPAGSGWHGAELDIAGLSGGHSGVQIHEHRANAIKLLVAVIDRLDAEGVESRLASVTGGSAHNAIPSGASALLALPPEAAARASEVVAEASEDLRREWERDEPGLAIRFEQADAALPAVASAVAARDLLDLLRALPHGVIAMSPRFEGTVASSANMALVRTEGEIATVLSSIRSLPGAELEETSDRVKDLGAKAGAEVTVTGGYPGWEPREASPLVATATAAFERIHRVPPAIEVVHGGLECGVLVAGEPRLDAISFGPLIKEAHTPQEHVYASTVADTWRLLLALLAS